MGLRQGLRAIDVRLAHECEKERKRQHIINEMTEKFTLFFDAWMDAPMVPAKDHRVYRKHQGPKHLKTNWRAP